MVRNWIIYLLGLAGALVFHAYYFGWYSWFVLQLMVILPLLSLLLSLPAMLRARLSLDVPGECLRQEAVYAALTTGGGFMPLPHCRFRLRVENVMTGSSKVIRQRVTGRDSWYVKLDTTHVGLLRCSAEKVRAYDYLRLFRIPARAGRSVEVLVKPQAEEPSVLPNLTRFLTKQLKPKPSGGFSEEHEMRSYRPGDPLRSVHWKLSAKTDDLIVREAQEPVRGKVLLTLDLVGEPNQIDGVLSRFLWLSIWLLEHEVPHGLTWIDPKDCRLTSEDIGGEAQLQQVLARLLRSRLRDELPSIAQRRFDHVDWRYHIPTEREVRS